MNLLVMVFVAASAIMSGVNSLGMTPEQETRYNELIAICQKEHNVPNEDFDRLRKSQFENTSHNAKCFLSCFGIKQQWVINDEINAEKFMKDVENVFGRDKIEQSVKKCIPVQGSDICEKIFQFYQCLKKNKTSVI